MKTSVEAIKEL